MKNNLKSTSLRKINTPVVYQRMAPQSNIKRMKTILFLSKIALFGTACFILVVIGKFFYDHKATIKRIASGPTPTPTATPTTTPLPTLPPTATPTPAPITPNFIAPGISWDVPPQTIPNSAQLEIPSIQIAIQNKFLGMTIQPTYSSIQQIIVADKWLQVNTGLYDRNTNLQITAQGETFFGEKLSTGWIIHIPDDGDYCTFVNHLPNSFLPPANKAYYCKYK